jgi:hypothetical protein
LSKQDFTTKADGICSNYNAKIKGALTNVGNDPAAIAAAVDKTIELIDQAQKEFKKLEPPKALDAKWKEWERINDDQVSTAKQLSAAARKKNETAFNSALAKLDSQSKDSNRIAGEMGLKSCAES